MTTFNLNKNNPPLLSKEAGQRLNSMTDEEIDYRDIPDLSEDHAFWTQAALEAKKRKKQLTLRLDDEVIEWFKAQGKGYQNQINTILKTYMKAHS